MPHDQAKAHIRKLRALRILYSVLTILYAAVLVALLMTDHLTIPVYLLCFLLSYLPWKLVWMVIENRVRKKHLYDLLFEEVNVPLFQEVLTFVSRDDPFALGQLYALYAEGRHADVVSLCAKQLNNPYAKRYRLTFLTYMEDAYFKLGDDAKLRESHEATERELSSFKNAEKVRKKLPVQGFYAAYLGKDPLACEANFTANPPTTPYAEINRLLMRSRVALLRQDTQEARRLLEQVQDMAPGTGLAATATAHLAAMERGEGYEAAYPEALPDPLYPVITTEKRHRIYRKLHGAILLLLGVLLLVWVWLYGGDQAEYEALCEDVRVSMEAEYDDVAVLECFTVSDGEYWLDSLALCTTNRGVVLAGLYYYDDPDETLCDPLVTLTEADFRGDRHPYRVFRGCTEEYYGACTFYDSQKEVPEDASVAFPVTVYGQELWFAVVYVGWEPPANLT